MSKCYVTDKDGDVRTVKNLGWLLRNNQRVFDFVFYLNTKSARSKLMSDGRLLASCWKDMCFWTQFASYEVLLRWLDRPVFRGLVLKIITPVPGDDGVESIHGPYRTETFIIGGYDYRELLRKVENSKPKKTGVLT